MSNKHKKGIGISWLPRKTFSLLDWTELAIHACYSIWNLDEQKAIVILETTILLISTTMDNDAAAHNSQSTILWKSHILLSSRFSSPMLGSEWLHVEGMMYQVAGADEA